jgi:hypothetical protein
MSAELQEHLKQLPGLDRRALLDHWLELLGKPAHGGLRREMLVPVLAYRMPRRSSVA